MINLTGSLENRIYILYHHLRPLAKKILMDNIGEGNDVLFKEMENTYN